MLKIILVVKDILRSKSIVCNVTLLVENRRENGQELPYMKFIANVLTLHEILFHGKGSLKE